MTTKIKPGIIHVAVANPTALRRITRLEWALAAAIATWSGSIFTVALIRLL